MYCGADFDAHDPLENEPYGFDFVKDVVAGEIVTQVTYSIAVVSGVDAAASSRIVGTPMINPLDGGTQTSQVLYNLLAGVNYRLTAMATTNFGAMKSLWAHAPGPVPN